MKSFKQFLKEGGNATSAYKTVRANASDISDALSFVSKAVGIFKDELEENLLGSTKQTLVGKKESSGDIDIAIPAELGDPEDIHKKMMSAVDDRGTLNKGTKVGSYAVPVNGKHVQVDLMFVSTEEWARWMYHASEDSAYPGAVRNILLFTALAYTQKEGEDFALRNDEGKVLARASKSIHMSSGMRRMFKVRKTKKDGELKGDLEKVTPEDISSYLKIIGKDIEFSHDENLTDDPDDVAHFIFGKNVFAKDLLTAEDVIKYIHQKPDSATIVSACKTELEKAGLPVPKEL